jgi:hypothetical protein
MKLDLNQLQKDIHEQYARQHVELGDRGTLEHLEKGRHWDLSGTLRDGGVLVFPHAGVQDCGYQIAACVQSCRIANSTVNFPLLCDCSSLTR